MTRHRSNAQSGDSLRVIIIEECDESCPARRAARGDVTATAIRAGDTVKIGENRHVVVEIMVEPGGITGVFMNCGRRAHLAAAVLQLDPSKLVYADANTEKICPNCGRTVVRYR